jgi:O-antigen/teichoic acid export membrane protein
MAGTRSAQGRVATNTIARVAGEAVAKLASLAFYVVLARQLGREDYGTFVFALTLTGTLLIGAGFGTDELTAREVARDRRSAGRYLSDVAGLKATTSVALLAVAMAVVFVGGYDADARLATLLVGLGVMVEVMARSWNAIFQAYQRLELVSVTLIVQRGLTAILGIAVLATGGGLVAAGAVYLTGALVAFVITELMWRRFTPATRPRPSRTGAWTLLRGGIPIGAAATLWVLLLKVDVLLLAFLTNNHEVGLYGAAARLVEGTQFVAWAFNAAMLPWVALTAGAALARGYMLGLKLLAAGLIPVGATLACFARPIVDLLYGDEFAGAALPLALLGCTVALYGLQSFSGTLLIGRDSPGVLVRIAGAVVIQNIACNLVAIPLWGADGAAGVALSSSVLMTVLTIWFGTRNTRAFSPVRAFGGPLLAGAALVAVALALPTLLGAILAGLAYAVVLAAFELVRHREDVRAYLSALPARRPDTGPVQ